jgi:hypothetical protein
VNRILGVKPYKGVGRRHEGIIRLSRWVVNRMDSQPRGRISPGELLETARRFLPDVFENVRIEPGTLRAFPRVHTVEVAVELPDDRVRDREARALELLVHDRPGRRAEGLRILAEIADPDLADWCAVCLEDESAEVRVAALGTMLECDEVDTALVEFLAECEERNVRAGALAVLAKHSGRSAARWFRRGLEDPETCVRLAVARMLPELDAARHRRVFELALHDPNPDVARRAWSLTAGKGYAKEKRGRGWPEVGRQAEA